MDFALGQKEKNVFRNNGEEEEENAKKWFFQEVTCGVEAAKKRFLPAHRQNSHTGNPHLVNEIFIQCFGNQLVYANQENILSFLMRCGGLKSFFFLL